MRSIASRRRLPRFPRFNDRSGGICLRRRQLRRLSLSCNRHCLCHQHCIYLCRRCICCRLLCCCMKARCWQPPGSNNGGSQQGARG